MLSLCPHNFGLGIRWEDKGLAVGKKLPASVLTRDLLLGFQLSGTIHLNFPANNASFFLKSASLSKRKSSSIRRSTRPCLSYFFSRTACKSPNATPEAVPTSLPLTSCKLASSSSTSHF